MDLNFLNMKITKHLLDNVEFLDSPNKYVNPFKTTTGLPDSIIIHYTAGTSFPNNLTIKKPEGGNASAHLVIERDGTVKQLVPFSQRAWHAGKSSYHGRSSYNDYSIGIEIINAGWLDKKEGDFYTRYYNGRLDVKVPAEEVEEARHKNTKLGKKYWHKYTDAQITKVEELCELLCKEYPVTEILGHDDISPVRKFDPGPLYPMDDLQDVLNSKDEDRSFTEIEDSGVVSIDLLNIRSGAGASNEKIAQPLKKGAKVEILEEKDGWYKVKAELVGWVNKKFIAE